MLVAAALVAFPGFSCRHTKDPNGGGGEVSTAPETTETPVVEMVTETVVGRILVLGADNAFVVFQLEAGETVAMGEELEVRFAGSPVAKIKVTPPDKKNRMIAADVLSGTVEKGYEVVRIKTEKTSAATP